MPQAALREVLFAAEWTAPKCTLPGTTRFFRCATAWALLLAAHLVHSVCRFESFRQIAAGCCERLPSRDPLRSARYLRVNGKPRPYGIR